MARLAGAVAGENPLMRRLALVVILFGALFAPASAWAAGSPPALVGSVSSSTALSGSVAVAVSGNYAYTTAYWAGELSVVDVSNPASPVLVGTTPSTPSLENGSNVTIAGNYAFVVSKNRNASTSSNDDGTTGNALTVVDISNPTSPQVVGSVRDPGKLFGAYGVAVSGHYAFVAAQGLLSGQPAAPDTSTGSLSVIDLNNLPAGVLANIDNGSLPGPWTGKNLLQHATSIAISGNYAYVTGFYSAHLTVFDISSPTAPTIVSSLGDSTHLAYPADVAVQGNYAYVADQNSGLNPEFTVVDVSTPSKPTVAATLSDSLLNGAYRIHVRNNFAYVSASGAATVAAIDVSDPTKPRIAGTVTDSAHLNSTTGLDLDPSGRYVIAASPRQSGQTGPLYPPFPLAGGPVVTGTISAIDLTPQPIAVTIAPSSEPANPTSQTSATFSFAVSDLVATAQCGLDGAPPGPCTSQTTQQYSGLAPGNHTFVVKSTDAQGHAATDSYSWMITAPPANTSAPTVSGSAVQGATLTASPGSWSGSPAPTFAYQWQRCDSGGLNCVAIAGATGQSYVLTSGDVGSTLVVSVTGSNSVGSATASSAATGVVVAAASAPVNTSAPTVSGSAVQGATLTASPGSWSGSPAPTFAYQWQRCGSGGLNCVALPGATSSTYTVGLSDVGSTLVVSVTGSNSVGSATASSAATGVVLAPPANTSVPTVSGSAVQGATLTASPGSWSGSPAPTYAYQWQRCGSGGLNCVALPGATSSTYTVGLSDVGSTLVVSVTGSNSAGSATASSAATGVVVAAASAPVNTSAPTVSGSAVQGATLTASPGSWSGSPAPTFAYQWQRCDSGGLNCVAIAGATGQGYAVSLGDVGSTLVVSVTGSNSAGSATASSAATGVVSSPPGPVTGLLDDFNRPDNTGPPSASWSHLGVLNSSATNNLRITGGQITGAGGINSDYWNPQTFGPDSEVWLTVVKKPVSDGQQVVLGLRFQNPGQATASGYQGHYIFRSSGQDQYQITKRSPTAETTLASVTGPQLHPGDQLLFRAVGSTMELWRGSAGMWTRLLTATDTTYNAPGSLVVTARDSAVRLDNFGGGALPGSFSLPGVPTARLSASATGARLRGGVVTVTVACRGATGTCMITALLRLVENSDRRLRAVAVGRRTVEVRHGSRATLRLVLTRAQRQVLTGAQRARVRLMVFQATGPHSTALVLTQGL